MQGGTDICFQNQVVGPYSVAYHTFHRSECNPCKMADTDKYVLILKKILGILQV